MWVFTTVEFLTAQDYDVRTPMSASKQSYLTRMKMSAGQESSLEQGLQRNKIGFFKDISAIVSFAIHRALHESFQRKRNSEIVVV